MSKKTVNLQDLLERRKTLKEDFDKVQTQLQNLEKMRTQLTSQGYALNGAMQQCDEFIELISESSPDSTIPSKDDSAVQTALS